MRQKKGEYQLDDASRRRFLQGMAATGGAAVLVAGAGHAFASADNAAEEPRRDVAHGYHETPHIREYYKCADF